MNAQFSEKLQAILDLWNGLRADRDIPLFKDFRPELLGRLSENTIMAAVLEENGVMDFQFLAVGSHLAERFGQSLYNRRVSTIQDTILRKALMERYTRAATQREPVYGKGDRELDKVSHCYEALTLPLGTEGQERVTHVLGVAVYYSLQQYRSLFGVALADRAGPGTSETE